MGKMEDLRAKLLEKIKSGYSYLVKGVLDEIRDSKELTDKQREGILT